MSDKKTPSDLKKQREIENQALEQALDHHERFWDSYKRIAKRDRALLAALAKDD